VADVPERPPRRSTRLRWVLIAAGVGLTALAIAGSMLRARLEGWVRPAIERRLAAAVGGSASLGQLELHLTRLAATFADLRLEVPAPGAEPLRVDVPAGSLALSWSSLPALAAGRVELAELRLIGPVVESDASFWDARERRAAGDAVDLRIGRLEVRGGRLRYERRETPAEFAARDVELHAGWSPDLRALAGRGSLRLSVRRPPLALPLDLGVAGEFHWRRHDVELRGVELRGPGVEADLDASLSLLAGVELVGRGSAALDLDRLGPMLAPGAPAPRGRLAGTFAVEAGASPFRLRGRFEGEGLAVGRIAADAAAFEARWTPDGLALSELVASVHGGRVEGAVEATWGEAARFHAALTATDVESLSLLRWLEVSVPLHARIDGSVEIEGEPSDPLSWTADGRFVARLPSDASAGVPIAGSGAFRIDGGRLVLRASQAEIGAASLDAALDVALVAGGRGGEIRLDGRTDAAERTQAATLSILERLGLGRPELLARPLSGRGRVAARIGLGAGAGLEVELDLADGAWAGNRFDSLALELGLAGQVLTLRRVALERGERSVVGSAVIDLARANAPAIRLEARSVELGWLIGLAGGTAEIEGLLDASVDFVEADGAAGGGGQLRIRGLRWLGESLDAVEARLAPGPAGTVRLLDLRASGPAIEGEGAGRWDPRTGLLELGIERGTVRVGSLAALDGSGFEVAADVAIAGDLRLEAGAVHGELALSGEGWRVAGVALGSGAGRLRLAPGSLAIELEGRAEFGWTARGTLELDEALPLDLDLLLDDVRLEIGPPRIDASAVVTARLRLAGPLASPARLELDGEIERGDLQLGRERLVLAGGVSLELREGRFSSGPIRLRGTAGDVTAHASYDLGADALDARAAGTIGLGLVLSVPLPGLRASGATDLELRIEGPLREPVLSGGLRCTGGRIRLPDLGQTLDDVAFGLELAAGRLTLDEFSARSGNGEIWGTARAVLRGGVPGEIRGELYAANFRVAYPEGFRGVYEAALSLEGELDALRVSGRVELLRGLYDRPLKLSELLAGERELELREESALPAGVALDVDVGAAGNLWVRNNFARFESAADLHVGGTLLEPEVTGRLQVLPGGWLEFRDVRYRILAASADLTERDRIDPYVALRAETSVGGTTIFLRAEGNSRRLEYELSSEPPLATQDIIALLTTGRTLESTSGTDLAGEAAANYFAGFLADPLTRRVERWAGLDRVQISPLAVETQGDPTARLTLAEEISKDVLVVFSTDVGGSERKLYRVEWSATDKVRLDAERDTRGGIGGTIGYRDRFWLHRPPAPTPAPGGAGESGAERPAAGPQVAAVVVRGVGPDAAKELAQRSGIATGDGFSRSEMLHGVERIRRYYVGHDRIEAQVTAHSVAHDGGVDVVYDVDPGPPSRLLLDGASARERRQLREELHESWAESVFHEDLYADSTELIRRYYHEKGFYAADVHGAVTERRGEREVRFTIDHGRPVAVGRVTLSGVQALPEERVRRQILTGSGGILSRDRLVPSVLAEDVRAIRQLYREQGFLQVRVEDPRVRLAADGAAALVEFVVEEGPRFLIERVEVTPVAELPDADLAAWTELVPGEVLAGSSLFAGEARLRARLDERGYPDAAVRGRLEIEQTRGRLRYEVEPGELRRVGRIDVRGNALTREALIRRELALEPGQPLSREKLLAGQRRLYRLGIFRNVRLTYRPLDGGQPTDQLVEVQVEESPPFVGSVSAGYDTEVGLKGGLGLSHENVGGRGRVLGLHTRASDLERVVRLSASERRLFGWPLPAVLHLGWEDRDEEGFSYERWSSSVRIDRRLAQTWTGFLRYTFQDLTIGRVEDPEELAEEKLEDVRLGDVGIAFVRDRRDDPLLFGRGTYLALSGRLFSQPLLSDRSFVKQEVQFSAAGPIAAGIGWVSSLRFGGELPFGSGRRATVPISESFYLGGDATLRGFARDELGPGEALLLLNQELRIPLWGRLKGALFYDAGQVHAELSDLDLDLRHVLGIGLRLETPIGPLRVEYGAKLDREPQETRGELFLAIGSAF